jgi:deoxyhypusine synthase
MKEVKDFEIDKNLDIKSLVKQMEESGGFTSQELATGVEILREMIADKECLKFLSFPADIIATGTRGIIRDFVKTRMFDVVITTCGTLDHDIARSYKKYYHGRFEMNDRELHQKGINRLGNVLVPNESYGILIEDKMQEFLNGLSKKTQEISTHELVWELGKSMDQDSIAYWAEKNKIPVIIPGITDGAVGYQMWHFSQKNNFKINLMRDESLLSDLVWGAKKSGALIVGGGISKHHTIWWNQFKNGLDYAVYLSTATEYDGSLSGAKPHEAISWGKINEKAKFVSIPMDATVALPIIFAALI